MAVTGLGYLLLFVAFILAFPLGNTHQINQDRIKQLLQSKEIGYTLVQEYSKALKEGFFIANDHASSFANTTCWKDLLAVKNDSSKRLLYLDAAGKPASGILQGNSFWLGSFSECEQLSDAHHCLTTFKIAQIPQGVIWGACFPKSCNNNEINENILKFLILKVEQFTKIKMEVLTTTCPGKAPYTSGVKVMFVICGALLLLCLIGTTLEWFDEIFQDSKRVINEASSGVTEQSNIASMPSLPIMPNTASKFTIDNHRDENASNIDADDIILLPKRPSKVHSILSGLKGFSLDFFLCFSLLHNTKKIFNTNVPPIAITSINGVRVISMSWVVLGHTFGNFVESPISENKAEAMQKDYKLLSIMPIIHGYYSVDSFFFLSGLLVAYTCFRKLKNSGGNFNWILFYVHRFWRLTPAYMVVILFSVELKRFLSQGPYWYTQYNDPMCSEYWWTNLLYINNFYPTNMAETCIGWTWYLANDMQFFVITPFLLYPMFKFGWRGLVLPVGVLLESTAITAFLYAHYDLDPLGLLKLGQFTDAHRAEFFKKIGQFMKYVYVKPYCRIQPYLVGFFLGYFMYKYCAGIKRPGWITTLLGWSLAAVAGMLLVYGPHDSILPGAEQWNKTQNVFYGTFERLIWGLVLAWVTYACHYGCGGLVQKFLSARFWIPLSRLTYSVYLIHLIVVALMFSGAEGTIHYDFHTVAYYFLAALVLSYGAGFILAVVVEFPCDNLENMARKYFKLYRERHR